MAPSALPVRVLVAGAGAFGKEHLARLARRSDVTIVGVADTNPTAFEPISSALGGVKVLTDPLRLIDEVEADALVIATPAASHVEISMRALARNLCVLLEKPVAPTASSAAPLLAAERRSTGFVLPGHVLRFSQDHARMIEIIRSGRIGKVIYVNSRRYRDESHAVRYPDSDPILMTSRSRHRPCAMGHRLGLPFGSRPPVRGAWLPHDDGRLSDRGDRDYLRLAHGLDVCGWRPAA